MEMIKDVNLPEGTNSGDPLFLLPAWFLVSDEEDIGGQL